MEARPKIIAGILTMLALLALLIYTATAEWRRLPRRQLTIHARAIENGADLYETNCRNCHGARGEGVGQLGPNISDAAFFKERINAVGWVDSLETYVGSSIAHGRLMATRPKYAGNAATVVMSPWLDIYGGILRKDQVDDLTAFVMNWQATAAGEVTLKELEVPKVNLDDPKMIEQGRQVFAGYCSKCHNVKGIEKASQTGPDLTAIHDQASARRPDMSADEYIRESVLIPAAYLTEGFDPKQLGYACGAVLSTRQLDQVVAFLMAPK